MLWLQAHTTVLVILCFEVRYFESSTFGCFVVVCLLARCKRIQIENSIKWRKQIMICMRYSTEMGIIIIMNQIEILELKTPINDIKEYNWELQQQIRLDFGFFKEITEVGLETVAHACNPYYLGGRDGRVMVWSQSGKKKLTKPLTHISCLQSQLPRAEVGRLWLKSRTGRCTRSYMKNN
jgi:hypothetical protein